MKINCAFTYFLCLLTSTLHAQITQISSINEYTQLTKQNNPVLVKFAADWCGVCKQVKTPFEEVAQEPEFNNVTFVNVDVDKGNSLAEKHQVSGIPTFIYINKGKQVNQNVGVQNMASFKEDLRSDLRKTFNLAQNETTKQNEIESEQDIIGLEEIEQPAQKETPQPAKGIVQTITDFFKKIIETIGAAVKYVIDKIMGLFR